MSIEKDEAAIQALLLSCGMDSGEISERPKIIKKGQVTKPLKYLKFEKEDSKESKYVSVVAEVLKVVPIDFLSSMKDEGWLEISYSRPYKDSEGGPIFLLGYPGTPSSSKDLTAGRKRFGEINSRFPIFNLVSELRLKYNSFSSQQSQAA